MSVIVKGMPMPRKCAECPFRLVWCRETFYMDIRPPQCPLEELPSVHPEPLTDKEQRIFLAAMGREEKVCMEVDRNYIREPYEDSLMRVCKEIRRKVKGALWT